MWELFVYYLRHGRHIFQSTVMAKYLVTFADEQNCEEGDSMCCEYGSLSPPRRLCFCLHLFVSLFVNKITKKIY